MYTNNNKVNVLLNKSTSRPSRELSCFSKSFVDELYDKFEETENVNVLEELSHKRDNIHQLIRLTNQSLKNNADNIKIISNILVNHGIETYNSSNPNQLEIEV